PRLSRHAYVQSMEMLHDLVRKRNGRDFSQHRGTKNHKGHEGIFSLLRLCVLCVPPCLCGELSSLLSAAVDFDAAVRALAVAAGAEVVPLRDLVLQPADIR